MSNPSILIVEDEKNLGETLVEYLQDKGYESVLAQSATSARELFQSANPGLIIMDIGLPDGNGLDLAREFRKVRKDFVLLFLSALNDPETKVEGLEIGAEDYMTKPFALRELTLRLERIYKSIKSTSPEELIFGPLKVWFKRFEVADAKGNIIPLNQKEKSILELLYQANGEAVTRDTILESVWDEGQFPSNRTIDNYIVKLRKWTETDESNSLEIQSIRGIGYKLIQKN